MHVGAALRDRLDLPADLAAESASSISSWHDLRGMHDACGDHDVNVTSPQHTLKLSKEDTLASAAIDLGTTYYSTGLSL